VLHIPCGVGGAPGGVCWGAHHVLGPHVHAFYAEPTRAPCCLLGLATGRGARSSVKDVGLDGRTVADGLAVARMSGLCFDMTSGWPAFDRVACL
jgi:D-serine dehydratase